MLNQETRHKIETVLPAWVEACDSGAVVLMTSDMFRPADEYDMVLMAQAIQYATDLGKEVIVLATGREARDYYKKRPDLHSQQKHGVDTKQNNQT